MFVEFSGWMEHELVLFVGRWLFRWKWSSRLLGLCLNGVVFFGRSYWDRRESVARNVAWILARSRQGKLEIFRTTRTMSVCLPRPRWIYFNRKWKLILPAFWHLPRNYEQLQFITISIFWLIYEKKINRFSFVVSNRIATYRAELA